MKFKRERFVIDTCGDLGAALDLIEELCAELDARDTNEFINGRADPYTVFSPRFMEYIEQ